MIAAVLTRIAGVFLALVVFGAALVLLALASWGADVLFGDDGGSR